MPPLPLPEPATEATLAEARRALKTQRLSLSRITEKIDTSEAALAQIVADSKCAIKELQRERAVIEERMFQTMAYLSPIRRLPLELLRQIFLFNFEDYPCCAWVLCAVSSLWRKTALSMPKIWSKIRLLTTQHSSADIIRLWLERSGNKVPLDIEIYLRVNKGSSETTLRPRPVSPTWGHPFPHHQSAHYVIPHPPHPSATIPILPPSHTPIIVPPPPSNYDAWTSSPSSPTDKSSPVSRTSLHWGYIAVYYLVEQMHRWERFVFRFDKHFSSMSALKSITGDGPMLVEFEVSCAEAAFYPEWPWLPSASSNATVMLPRLQSLTLQFTPFKWSSPILRTNLRSLNLRALPTNHLPLDRILYLVSSNPNLQFLALHFSAVLPAILPLTPITLPELKDLSLGGHYLLSQLADYLILPSIDTLSLDIEARDPIEDTISNLLARSNHPPLEHLSVAYGNSNPSSFYYGPGGVVISWTVLADLTHLQSLRIGGTPLEPLLTALGPPDEDQSHWACPNLVSLALRNCHSHSDGVAKLVQMVDARNPDVASSTLMVNGVAPAKLKQLELYDCASLGQDVVNWLKGRVEEVLWTEPTYERSPLTGNPYL